MVDDFALHLTSLANQLDILSDLEPSHKVVEILLQVVPPRFAQIALSIETMLDISTLSIEEVKEDCELLRQIHSHIYSWS